jgi:hypothetical protein
MTQGRFKRRFVALFVVVALHFFLIVLWVLQPIYVRVVDDDPSSVLFFIESPRPPPTTTPAVQPRATQATPTVIPDIPEPSTAEQTSSAPTAPTPSATIDWTAQASAAAAAVIDKAIREETRKCDPSDSPNSFLPPCNPRTKKFEWDQPRVGFSGGLPYVRIGERCAVGLGFFGCGFGDPPPANGDLFEGMDDPERDRSSVPSPNP